MQTTQTLLVEIQILIYATSNEPLIAAPILIFSNQTTNSLSTTGSPTQWQYNWTVPSNLSQTISITVQGYDLENNPNTQTSSLSYTIDSAGASVELETNQEDPYLKAGESIVVTATFSEAIAGECTLEISNNSTTVESSMSAISSSVWTVEWELPTNWNEGDFSVKIGTANKSCEILTRSLAVPIFTLKSPSFNLYWIPLVKQEELIASCITVCYYC